jgi:MerR family transcriptional regulator, light-induced transcriptional regulator
MSTPGSEARLSLARFPELPRCTASGPGIWDAPDHPGCVAGWEHPGQHRARDPDRIFEVLWSVDPGVVPTAARIATVLAAEAAPGLPDLLRDRLSEQASASSADLRRASGLIERTLDYLAR